MMRVKLTKNVHKLTFIFYSRPSVIESVSSKWSLSQLQMEDQKSESYKFQRTQARSNFDRKRVTLNKKSIFKKSGFNNVTLTSDSQTDLQTKIRVSFKSSKKNKKQSDRPQKFTNTISMARRKYIQHLRRPQVKSSDNSPENRSESMFPSRNIVRTLNLNHLRGVNWSKKLMSPQMQLETYNFVKKI